MKNDKKIEKVVAELESRCHDFLSTVKSLGNHCAWTDRKVEGIIELSEELKKLHESQFKNQ